MEHERVLISGTHNRCFYSALCLALLFVFVQGAPPSYPDCAGSDVQYVVDLTQSTTEFPHFWEECVGSGHALLGMRSDWQAQLARAHAELGFQQVRFHGIFDDDMSTLLYLEDGVATYSFFNIDTVYDFLVSIGMRPLVELSFMPELIASGNQTIFHYKGNITPPSNYTQWADLITNFVSHLVDRYGINEILTWSFEVWNEPNCGFWTGDQQEYFHLLQITYDAIKSVDSRIMVGGPATCQSQWLNDTIAFAKSQGFELDFISTHEYPTDPLPALGPTNRDTLKNVLTLSRETVGPDTVLYYTEYNDGLYSPGFHDDPFAAAFVIKNVKDVRGLVQLFSFWTFSDIFEEGGFISTPFHQGFGMMTIHGVPKPSWRAFQLLHQAGTFLLNDTLLTVLPPGVNYTTVDILATANQTSDGQITGFQILVTNHDVPPNVVNNQSVCLIVNLPESASGLSATFQQINQWNANPVVCWEEMGSPQYLNSTQVDQLNACAEITPSTVEFGPSKYSPTAFSTIIEVPPEGVAAFTFTVSA